MLGRAPALLSGTPRGSILWPKSPRMQLWPRHRPGRRLTVCPCNFGHARQHLSAATSPAMSVEAAVGVEAVEPERARVRDEDHPEADDEQECCRPARPGAAVAGVEVDRVGEPGHEGRRLLG